MSSLVQRNQSKYPARALLVGCGELGSRHLQALASIPAIREIEVVEPRPEGQALGKQRLAEVNNSVHLNNIHWISSLNDASSDGDICIIATHAGIRGGLVREIATYKGYSSFLLEKLVTPSLEEYEELINFANKLDLSVWVNCKSRAHYSHKRAKERLNPIEPMRLNVFGGNHGLATNGIHIADLFCFYTQSDQVHLDESMIDPILHPSKRGKDFFDLSGYLSFHDNYGSQLQMTLSANHHGPVFFSISSKSYRAAIDDETKCFYESTPDTSWEWTKIPYDANIFVSNMTREFVRDIIATGQCELPTLESCYPAHRLILGELLVHFNELTGTQSSKCPVT